MRLTSQIVLLGAAVLALVMLAIGWTVTNDQRIAYREQARYHAHTLHASLAEALADRVFRGENLRVERLLRDIRDRDMRMAYIYVTDYDDRLLAHTFADGFPRALLDTLNERQSPPAERYFRTAETGIYHVSAPLIDGLPARLYIGLSDSESNAAISASRDRVLFSAVLLGGIGLLAGGLLAARIGAPLRRLADLMARYANGESVSPSQLPAYGALEIRRLTNAIASMLRERGELEATLINREADLIALIETSPIGLALTRMDGTLVELNPAFAEIVGYSPAECLGLTYWQLTPEDYAQQEQAQLDSLETTGRYGPYEKEYLHRDGQRVPVRLSGRIIERQGERYIWSSVEDLTTSRAARVLGSHLRQIFDNAVEEFYVFDDQTLLFSQVSAGALANLGYTMDQMRRMTPVDIKPEYSFEEFNSLIAPLRDGATNRLFFETVHQRADGTSYPVEVRLQYSREITPTVFFAIILDLTLHKGYEAEINAHRRHLEELVERRTATIRQQARIIDQTHDALITTDLNGYITTWNGGAQRLFGFEPDRDHRGRHVSCVYPEDQHAFLAEHVIAPLKEKGRHEAEVVLLRGNGERVPAHLSLSLLYDDDGKATGMSGFAVDISELKRRESELETLARQLQAANQELEAFSYSVSHDLRAPLRAIDGFSLALLEDCADAVDDTGRDYLRRVRAAAQRMGRLIDDLLNLSRVGRGELASEPLDLGGVARQVIDELQAGEPNRHAAWRIDEKLAARGDPRLIHVVLSNLLGNAWKFTANTQSARIRFGALSGSPGVFYVSDNGAGFDMRHADNLFGAFRRLHSAAEFPGSGVGLATVQRVIHRHGGWVRAESRPGEGATFYFSLEPGVAPPASGEA